MPFEYKGTHWNDLPFDPERCKASVIGSGRGSWCHQCSRKPWKDGWCKQHHPDTEAARRKKNAEKEQQKRLNSLLVKARLQIAELEKRAETSLYIPPELMDSFVTFLEIAIDNMLLDFGSDLDKGEIAELKRLQSFCKCQRTRMAESLDFVA